MDGRSRGGASAPVEVSLGHLESQRGRTVHTIKIHPRGGEEALFGSVLVVEEYVVVGGGPNAGGSAPGDVGLCPEAGRVRWGVGTERRKIRSEVTHNNEITNYSKQ